MVKPLPRPMVPYSGGIPEAAGSCLTHKSPAPNQRLLNEVHQHSWEDRYTYRRIKICHVYRWNLCESDSMINRKLFFCASKSVNTALPNRTPHVPSPTALGSHHTCFSDRLTEKPSAGELALCFSTDLALCQIDKKEDLEVIYL